MKRFPNLILCATLACGAAAAHAGTQVRAADLPRISNGGTGFSGVTESVGMAAHRPVTAQWNANTTSIPLRAGEATTMVNGRPNANPDAPMAHGGGTAGERMQPALRAMGGSGGAMADRPAGAHRGWGTPD